MYRNLEHYKDPTAGDAISNTKRPQRGEVWLIQRKNGTEVQPVLVIDVHNYAVNVVAFENRAYDDCYAVRMPNNKIKYYDPCRLNFQYYNNFEKCIARLEESEFDKVLANIRHTINLWR